MRELSMHILDIAQNSISAGASVIKIVIDENLDKDILTIIVEDNGKGMDKEELLRVTNPFFTSRTTRRVGLGIPMFKASAEACDGTFYIDSAKGKGTYVKATFKHSHIDRVPLGNMADTMVVLISSNTNIDFVYKHKKNDKIYMLDTKEIKEVLGEVPINSIEVLEWVKNNVIEGLKEL
ncbi:ATP-binding protein [Paramaledivibacter caminithermalis]|jgi:nitrogen fixation/metabolism regulation signal transduction histidine kinase|uniref:histidine kinase n=1 Tax=Paramaledivibacter caminithermalis (strain DSM 15212 / CIP 107654 / DViRD3) TaxID=1121301 RepID=A0A1M6MEK8_PARC5|nr:ATP-binding protein [Paramaledivibacter caminithermalis]SHJ81911.1 Histidine kinase-, DNA gyrase B-, and HSP90-like ATPase [Paramaledivibacter caminithermalis DSM 15212]